MEANRIPSYFKPPQAPLEQSFLSPWPAGGSNKPPFIRPGLSLPHGLVGSSSVPRPRAPHPAKQKPAPTLLTLPGQAPEPLRSTRSL